MKLFEVNDRLANKLSDGINSNRSLLMGVAIWAVLVYHLFLWIYNPLGRFNIGATGVDVFFFLSGLGCARSLAHNGVKQFYINRIRRIYPVLFVAVTVVFLLSFPGWGLSDFLLNLTPLGFYLLDDTERFDWYIEAMLSVYLLFPVILSITRRWPLACLLTVTVVALGFEMLYGYYLPWHYNLCIGRLPILIYGMVFDRLWRSSPAVTAVCMALGVMALSNPELPIPWGYSLLGMPVIALSLCAARYISKPIQRHLAFMGRHSLEIYCANILALCILNTLFSSVWSSLSRGVVVLAAQIVMSAVLIYTNQLIANRLVRGKVVIGRLS